MKQFSKELGKVSITPKGDWDSSITNEKLDIVYDRRNNQAYIAKQDVPVGVDIDNREYWQPLNVSGYADNNFINLTAENENGIITAYESLEEAVATIFPINRRVGATLSFYNLNSDRLDRQAEFELWQFNSTDLANWENKDYWNNIYYNWNVFAGWYIDVDALNNHVETPNVGQYAYVGSNLNDALLYQCRTNGTWTNTGIKVRNYISVVVSGNITIGENGNWFSDGEDTGIPATPAVDEQLDNIIMQLQQHTTEINNIKKYNANLQDQITSNDNDITNLTAKHESLSRTVQGIAATGGASTATNVTYNNNRSGLNAENAQDAIDELQGSKIDKTSILQESGGAEDKVMSQKAVSAKLRNLSNDLAKKAATKFYLSNDSKVGCTAKFDDENGTVVFSPIVTMRRFNGEKDKFTDIHKNLVAAGCAYDEKTGLCSITFGKNADNANISIYYLNGVYGVTPINNYSIPKDAELVLHIGKNPTTFYFYGGAAAIWTECYNYLKLQKAETKAAKKTANQVITQFSRQYEKIWALGQKKITLLHFSDIHGDEKNFKRIVQYVEENKSMLTDIICTGDIVNFQFSDGIDWWKNNIGDNKILMAIGNHDPLVTQGTWDWFGKNAAECYDRYFSHFIANWGVNYTQDLCYYYKDYSDVSIRLIVLDGMRWNNIKEDTVQEAWFKQQLNDAKEKNLHVIVASHFPPDTSVGNKNNNINFDCWYSAQTWETEQYGLLSPKVADSVDSFQKNGGNFICYIGGHTHGDLFRPLKRYPNQLMVIVANASCYEHVNNADCWYSRSESDNSQELFNLLNIDTENKILSIVRIGCCFDRYARHIGTISFDYENHKVLSQY